ncbi:hypothetical protein [Parvularcula dongshanensis]|uniref:Uncharacterized protein n=1 Tax=Parvularcula dongshanensis TaxID=1173995 RepID=A0A840I1B8_9PROT|nr:hypothetical protein [Parvularcula dongshanensis]MBB4658073.1 hypothetical protein [Parvularcula dongshanensis]
MTIKEKSLIDAVSNLGPLPDFFVEGAFRAGATCIFMCGVFGGVVAVFNVMGRGLTEALVVLAAVRFAAFAGMGAGMVIATGALIGMDDEEDDVGRPFFFGGLTCLAALAFLALITAAPLRAWLEDAGSLQ